MDKQLKSLRSQSGNAIVGGLLVLLGAIFLVGELLDIRIGQFVWPFFIIGPGLLLFILALLLEEDIGRAFASISGMVTMVGLILLYQSVTGHWASWSYTWALVAPTSVGLGLLAFGWLKGQPQLRQEGWKIVKTGLSIFVVAAIFFELIIGVGGFGLGRIGWPVLLIALGVFLFFRNLTTGLHHE